MQALLFDFDGVLGNTMEDNFLAWQDAMRGEGIEINREAYFLLEGMKLPEIAKILCAKNGKICEDPEAIVQRKEAYYLKNAKFSLYSGVPELLQRLAREKMPLALVTGARRGRLDATLPKDFMEKFGAIVTSDRFNRGKPFPDPYLEAAHDLCVAPADCTVIENAPLGIQAAKAAGMRCIAIASTLSQDKLVGADIIVNDIGELSKKLVLIPHPQPL